VLLDVSLDGAPEKMSRERLEYEYEILRREWQKEFAVAEEFRRQTDYNARIKQNPTGFLKDIGLQYLNKKTLIRMAMLRYNGISDYPISNSGQWSGQAPFTREEIAENYFWYIDPPSGNYAAKLKQHAKEILEEKLGRKLDSDDTSREGNALAAFFEEEKIYELIAQLNQCPIDLIWGRLDYPLD
jgi:hypothetical protein